MFQFLNFALDSFHICLVSSFFWHLPGHFFCIYFFALLLINCLSSQFFLLLLIQIQFIIALVFFRSINTQLNNISSKLIYKILIMRNKENSTLIGIEGFEHNIF